MGSVRYGARPPEQIRNREVEATSTPIWSRAVTVVFETDPEAIASVLPRPLEPSAPTARLRIAVVDMGTGLKPFGAGWFGVRARHGDTEGEYALFMPMTTEQATVGGRETFGEPKKIAEMDLEVDGDILTARIARMGSTVAEVSGTLGAEAPGTRSTSSTSTSSSCPTRRARGWRATRPSSTAAGTRWPGWSVRSTASASCWRRPLDPVADFPVRKVVSFEYAEISSSQRGEVVGRVPAEWLEPFMHQRYDDLSVLGARS